MDKHNPFSRLWRWLTRAEKAEALMAEAKIAYVTAQMANNTPAVRGVMREVLGEESFKKLLPEIDPLDHKTILAPGTEPALWGDILLRRPCDYNVRESAARWIRDVTKFHAAGGLILNRPDVYGNRPTDYIFNDAYKAYKTGYSSGGYPVENAKRIQLLQNLGFSFDEKNRFVLDYVQPQRMSPYTGEYRDAGQAYYEKKKPEKEVLNKLRLSLGELNNQSNVISITRKA